ncbi:MerR family transcriptional regulator [Schleiferilactobacillus shenzhenensis]|nr:MerR family transcriptional regulator [Schleiferilactobacillus shenzhenensis]
MQLAEFVAMNQTTRDTVRHYIDLGLLTPQKQGKNYAFTAADTADFAEIVELKEMGFSLAAIQSIKERHDTQCGTPTQWQANRELVEDELATIEKELQTLMVRKTKLTALRKQLDGRLQQ